MNAELQPDNTIRRNALTKPRTIRKDRWNRANYDQIQIRVPKGDKDDLVKRIAEIYGDNKSLNSFIVESIREKLERDGGVK